MRLKRRHPEGEAQEVATREVNDPSLEPYRVPVIESSEIRKRFNVHVEPKQLINNESNVW